MPVIPWPGVAYFFFTYWHSKYFDVNPSIYMNIVCTIPKHGKKKVCHLSPQTLENSRELWKVREILLHSVEILKTQNFKSLIVN